MNERQFMENLNQQIDQHNTKLGDLLKQKQELDEKISQVQQWLDKAKALREVEYLRLGIPPVAQPSIVEGHQFFGMTPRDAIRAALKEKGRPLSKSEIFRALHLGGFDFKGHAPKRVIHFALVKDPQVKKIGGDIYDWIEESAR